MKIGVMFGLAYGAGRPEFLDHLAVAVEERGIESVWVAEHVVLFDSYDSRYPYSPDGRAPVPADAGLLEPFVALSYLAARTTTVRLGTGICIVGQRNPVYTAKQVADLDVLSRGRVDFGVGVGWLREEYEALNVPWANRGLRTDDHLAVMRALWTDEVASYSGRYYELPPSRLYPKPVQTPHPPIHVGGGSDAALRRAARFGQGYNGMNITPEDLPGVLTRLDVELEKEGRSRDGFQISIAPAFGSFGPGLADRYRDLGVDRLIVPLAAFGPEDLDRALDALTAAGV
ncbi:LLM class F420-dependent oxidoreductase [Sporichthya brevicatena]|uniref:LLM class F420-dependent oxidoreductase n=1 Tax=Sporichthya brevicatena TaxID=171442 RepID=A0ABN1GRK8_9ACTN